MEEQLIGDLAKDIAPRQQNGDPLDQLADEDVASSSNTLVGLRVPSISNHQKGNSLITSAVFAAVKRMWGASFPGPPGAP